MRIKYSLISIEYTSHLNTLTDYFEKNIAGRNYFIKCAFLVAMKTSAGQLTEATLERHSRLVGVGEVINNCYDLNVSDISPQEYTHMNGMMLHFIIYVLFIIVYNCV